MSQKRARCISPDSSSQISKSSPIEDRSSTFIAFFSPTLPPKELQAHPDFKSASHRITAWRKLSSQRALDAQQRLLETGYDDDGEKYGGKALERVLVEMQIQGSVVVARWYGGVMLGPVRFDHIKNSARDAIMRWSRDSDTSSTKKAKLRADADERDRLLLTLPERDQSIVVLRELLAEKSGQQPSSGEKDAVVKKTTEYSAFPLATLAKLEHVRDATIGWILKQIEKVEREAEGVVDAEVVCVPTSVESPKASIPAHQSSEKVIESIGHPKGHREKKTPPDSDDQ